MSKVSLKLVAAFLLTVCSTAAIADAPDPDRQTRIDAAFAEIEERGYSVIVGIGSTEHAVQQIAEFGMFRQDDVPAAETQLDILSITKMVTAIAVLDLVEDGTLRLDETLSEIFPDTPADKSDITVHQLLTHSAGFAAVSGDDYELIDRAEFIDRVLGTKLVSSPGEAYSYSNPGYTMLVAIVEVRGERSFEAYLREVVLDAVELSTFGYEAVYDAEKSARSRRGEPLHEASWGGDQASWNLIGGGGLIATAADFLTFRRLLMSGEVLKPETLELALTPHIREYKNHDSFYGYGVVIEDDASHGRVYMHNGGSRFFSSDWVEYPATGDVLFVAGPNTDEGNAYRAMRVLRKHLYPAED